MSRPKKIRENDSMWGWYVHGISQAGKWDSTGNEYFCECPWCFEQDKLYINPNKRVYNCKVCGEAGNYISFLTKMNEVNQAAMKDEYLEALASDRGLPIDAFRDFGIGWNGAYYTLPVLDLNSKLVGLKLYRPGEKLMNSPGVGVSLYQAQKLKNYMGQRVYLAEGEWDTIAMTWLLKEVDEKGVVVGVPGAHSNIDKWEMSFYDKDVVSLYDHDKAGIDGEMKVYQTLETKVRTLHFLHWPEEKKEGYDMRDHISKWYAKGDIEKCFRLIGKWLHEVPRKLAKIALEDTDGKLTLYKPVKMEPISFEELIKAYQSYLYLPNIDAIKVILATVFANRIRSEMVWMFIVAPPSSGKSELITTLYRCPEIEAVSKLTEHTLVSGFLTHDKTDQSLIDKLRNRILAIKDFTPILSMQEASQEQIFGVLRDAYDGQIDVMFGHGQHKRYTGIHFGIIAGVTGKIEALGNAQVALGERFLRYYMPDDNSIEAQHSKSMIALNNISYEDKNRKEIKDLVHRFIQTHQGGTPIMPKEIREKIFKMAMFTSLLRGVVPRDWKERVQYHPSVEGPMRLAKQLGLMAFGLASLEKKSEVDKEDLRIIKQIAVSSCPDVVRTLVRAIYRSKIGMSKGDLEAQTKFPVMTIKYVLDDLKLLNVVTSYGGGFKIIYELTGYARQLIDESGIYSKQVK